MARYIPSTDNVTVCEINRTLVNVRRGDQQALREVQNNIQAYLYPTLSTDLNDPSDLLVDAIPTLTYWGAVKEPVPARISSSSTPPNVENTPPDSQSPRSHPNQNSHPNRSSHSAPKIEQSRSTRDPRRPSLHRLRNFLSFLVTRATSAVSPLLTPPQTPLEPAPLSDLHWHSDKQRLAVIGPHDRILLYDLEVRGKAASVPGVLSHEFQRGVRMVRWRPRSAGGLAVACRTGVCFWTLTPPVQISPLSAADQPRGSISADQLRGRPSVRQRKPLQARMVFFQSPGGGAFTALEWTPNGRLLAASSEPDGEIVVYDVATGASVPLRRGLGGEAILQWSPSGDLFFSAKTNGSFHLWETARWASEPWASQSGRVVAATWSPDSRAILLAFENSTTLGAVHLTGKPPSLDAHLIPLELPEVETLASRASSTPGIEHMAWDAGGDRLAVSYPGGDAETRGLVAVYDTRRTPVVAASFVGVIRGPTAGSKPLALSFFNKFARGSLLAVAWSSSQVSVYPLLYKGR